MQNPELLSGEQFNISGRRVLFELIALACLIALVVLAGCAGFHERLDALATYCGTAEKQEQIIQSLGVFGGSIDRIGAAASGVQTVLEILAILFGGKTAVEGVIGGARAVKARKNGSPVK